jgi:PAS domain S-box-containing protein
MSDRKEPSRTASPLPREVNETDERAVVAVSDGKLKATTEDGRPSELTVVRESNLYRALFDAASDAVFVLDEGQIIEINPSAVRLLRQKRSAILGETLLSFSVATQPDGRDSYDKLHEKMGRALEGFPQTFDWLHVRSDNSTFFSEISLGRILLGHTTQLLAVMRDITDRKRAEEALRLSAMQFEANLENTPHVAIQWYDEAGRILYANRASEAIYGWPVTDVVGQSLGRLMFMPEQVDHLILSMMALEDDAQSVGPSEFPIHRKNGSSGWVLATNFVIPMAERRRAFVCMAVDITEQKRAEASLKRQEETFRALTESSIDIIIRFDEIGIVLYANPAVFQKLGLSVDGILGKTVREIGMSDSFCQLWDEASKTVYRSGQVRRFEYQWENGLWFDWLLMPEFDEEHRVRALIASARDVTERKRTDEERARFTMQLQQSTKMEAVGRLAGGVAHDFNNLLTAIKGSLNLALLDLEPGSAVEEVFRDASQAADSATRLTRQLLAFSRKQTVLPRPLDLNLTIVQTEKMLTRLLSEDIELTTILAEDLSEVNADPGQMEQVLINLVVNAKDAMPQGGRIVIETRNVELDEAYYAAHPRTAVGHFAMLTVSDTGCGMTEEVQGHLFEPFFTTKAVGVGTGLGLATAYGAIRQAGGYIEVDSEVGKGTTFRIYLPRLETSKGSRHPPVDEGEIFGGTETVLLVEDDDVLRQLSEKMLTRLGYRVLVAKDGAIALKMAREFEGTIELLFSDVVLPGMDGKQVADAIVEIRPNTKVLLTSGYTDDVLNKYDLAAPVFAFIPKPFTLRAIADKVREALGSSK